MNLLELENLNVKAINADKDIVKSISLSVPKGKTVAIIGESGSGKSVSVKAITGLSHRNLIVDSNKMEFNNCELTLLNKKERRDILGKQIGFIFQDPNSSLNPLYKIKHQLLEAIDRGTRNSKLISDKNLDNDIRKHMSQEEKTTRMYDLLRAVRLKNIAVVAEKYPHQLSGGQKQRVMIAIAIANNPKLLIADEPTTALDVTVQKEIMVLLKSLVSSMDMSMIFISHDLSLVKFIADYVYIMYNGYVLEAGVSKRVFENPLHPYTSGLISASPEMAIKGQHMNTISRDIPAFTGSGEFFSICSSVKTKADLDETSHLKEIESEHFVRVYL